MRPATSTRGSVSATGALTSAPRSLCVTTTAARVGAGAVFVATKWFCACAVHGATLKPRTARETERGRARLSDTGDDTRTDTHAILETQRHTHTHAHTHTHRRTHTHTHTHKHSHTLSLSLSPPLPTNTHNRARAHIHTQSTTHHPTACTSLEYTL